METSFVNTLPENLRDFVKEQISAGGFASTDAYLQSVLEAEEIRLAQQEVNQLIQEAIASGPETPVTKQDWIDLKNRLINEFSSGSTKP